MKDEVNGIKRYLVSVAVILTVVLLTQTGALLWWGGTINTKVETLEKCLVKVEERVTTMEQLRMVQSE